MKTIIKIKRSEWNKDCYSREEMYRHIRTRYYDTLMDSLPSPSRCYDEPWLKIRTKEGIKFAPLSSVKFFWDKNWQKVVRLINDSTYTDISLADVWYVLVGDHM